MGARKKTPHQQAEAVLTACGLTFPETSSGPAWPPTRALYMRRKMFTVFGAKGEGHDALTLIMKLPISAEMVQDLYYVRESKGWYRQHNWVIAHFGPDDDVLAEIDTLKAWLLQSYCAIAPKKLAMLARGA
jgi:hypothetical protein